MADEKKRVAEAYIIEFYNDVIALTRWYANYMTIGLELEGKYGEEILKSASEAEMAELKNILTNLRYHILKSYIWYESIVKGLQQEPNNTLGMLYTRFNTSYLLKREELEQYIKTINSVLVENTQLKALLENSVSVVSDLYGESESK